MAASTASDAKKAIATPTTATAAAAAPFNYYSATGVNTVDGKSYNLSALKGTSVTIVINVACECGYTAPGYQALQKLIDMYGPTRLVVHAWPCNQFGGTLCSAAGVAFLLLFCFPPASLT